MTVLYIFLLLKKIMSNLFLIRFVKNINNFEVFFVFLYI